MIDELAEHLVDKGHFGYLPIPPCNKRGESNGFTKTMRLEVNEPRSYFVMSGDIADKVQAYLNNLASNIRTLIDKSQNPSNFDPIQYFCSPPPADAAAAQDMSQSYNEARKAMLAAARDLIHKVRHNKYNAETITFSKSGVKIVAKAEKESDSCSGFTLSDKDQYEKTEKIILYVNIHEDKVKIDTIFPCKENKAQKEKVIVQKGNDVGTSTAASQRGGRGRPQGTGKPIAPASDEVPTKVASPEEPSEQTGSQ